MKLNARHTEQKMIATNKVVILASRIVPIEAVFPFLYAAFNSLLTFNLSIYNPSTKRANNSVGRL